jgi:hypothetical protein
MNMRNLHTPLHRFLVAAMLLFFTAGSVGATYSGCAMQAPTAQEAQPAMTDMDCASMDMSAPSKPKTEKHCCLDYSCPKCFSSPLMTTRLEASLALPRSFTLAVTDIVATKNQLNRDIERPPKYA